MRGEDTLAGWRGGGGVNILEDARHSSVLYICKYFVDIGEKGDVTTKARNRPALAYSFNFNSLSGLAFFLAFPPFPPPSPRGQDGDGFI